MNKALKPKEPTLTPDLDMGQAQPKEQTEQVKHPKIKVFHPLHKPTNTPQQGSKLVDNARTPLFSFSVYARMLTFLKSYWIFGLVSILGAVLFSVSVVLVADLMQFILDTLGGNLEQGKGIVSDITLRIAEPGSERNQPLLRLLIPLIMLGLVVLRGCAYLMNAYSLNYMAASVAYDLRNAVFRKVMCMRMQDLEWHGRGYVISTLTGKVNNVAVAINKTLLIFVREGVTLIALMSYLLYINWKLSIVFFAIVPIIAYIVRKAARRVNSYVRRVQLSERRLYEATGDALDGYKDIQMFQGRAIESARYAFLNNYNRKQGLHIATVQLLTQPLLQILLSSALALLVWMALAPEDANTMSPGQFTSYLVAAGLISSPARSLSGLLGGLQKALVAANDVFALLDSEPEIDRGHYSVRRAKGRLEFRNVFFRYGQTGDYVLKDISFVAEPGETIAIVGRTGSGKSTLINVIMRFLYPQRGTVLLDDMDIQEYQLDVYRRQIAVIMQQPFILNATIAENILYGSPKQHSDQQLEKIADMAYVNRFAKTFPDGLNTQLGLNGQQLSGGQKQRVAIARALTKDAPLLIMDEATSSLDTETEHYVQKATKEVRNQHTAFVIAHRLGTVQDADKILVIDRGEIIESGTHQQLFKQDGLYARLYQQKFED